MEMKENFHTNIDLKYIERLRFRSGIHSANIIYVLRRISKLCDPCTTI